MRQTTKQQTTRKIRAIVDRWNTEVVACPAIGGRYAGDWEDREQDRWLMFALGAGLTADEAEVAKDWDTPAPPDLAYSVAKYHQLLYAVVCKWPGESRHETALRYIRQAEEQSDCAPSSALPHPPEGSR